MTVAGRSHPRADGVGDLRPAIEPEPSPRKEAVPLSLGVGAEEKDKPRLSKKFLRPLMSSHIHECRQ
jgi:hypothetical protein